MLDFEELGVVKVISDILLETRHFCWTYFSSPGHDPGDSSDFAIHDRICSIHCRIMQIPSGLPAGSREFNITESCRWATAIFLYFPFDDHFPDPTLMINSLLHELKAALMPVVPCFPEENLLMLWILAVGGVAAFNLPERTWFVSNLMVIVSEMGLGSWEEMKRCLQMAIWADMMSDAQFRHLWEDVTVSAECLAVQDPFLAIDFAGSCRLENAESSDSGGGAAWSEHSYHGTSRNTSCEVDIATANIFC